MQRPLYERKRWALAPSCCGDLRPRSTCGPRHHRVRWSSKIGATAQKPFGGPMVESVGGGCSNWCCGDKGIDIGHAGMAEAVIQHTAAPHASLLKAYTKHGFSSSFLSIRSVDCGWSAYAVAHGQLRRYWNWIPFSVSDVC